MKKIAVSNLGEEELSRFKRVVRTRNETRAEADELFGETAKKQRKTENEMMMKLFEQFPASVTMQPSLQKVSTVEDLDKYFGEEPNSTKHVDAYFEKRAYLTDAQKRYPELLKAASAASTGGAGLPTPNLSKKKGMFQGTLATNPEDTSGPVTTQSNLSRP
jgi:hypothetical protein